MEDLELYRSYFFTKKDLWSFDALQLANKAAEVLEPLFREAIESGRNPKEIAYILINQVIATETELILEKRISYSDN